MEIFRQIWVCANRWPQHYLSNRSFGIGDVSKDEKFYNQVRTALLDVGFTFGPSEEGSNTALNAVAELKRPVKHPKKVTLVVPGYHHRLAKAIETTFKENGISCDRRTFEGDIAQDQDIISIVDFGDPYVYDITEAKFRDFADRLSGFKRSVVWVTPSAQIECKNPNSSMILGLTRTLRAEIRKDITVVEANTKVATFIDSSKSLFKIYQSLSHRSKAKDVDLDYEYAIVDGEIKIPRIQWTTAEEELTKRVDQSTADVNGSQVSNGEKEMSVHFRSDACYLLVGGLGGLGRMISTWMVENGARNILFLSRSAKEGSDTTPFFDELRRQGCEISAFAGSVNDLADVKAAVKQATRPVAGIMQMSAVMRVCRSSVT